jgi:hypothetical protein
MALTHVVGRASPQVMTPEPAGLGVAALSD